jgi:hypothetical protein
MTNSMILQINGEGGGSVLNYDQLAFSAMVDATVAADSEARATLNEEMQIMISAAQLQRTAIPIIETIIHYTEGGPIDNSLLGITTIR